MDELKRNVVNFDAVPEKYPTHVHQPGFWESLGRLVATFGFLEEILSKAIFSFTATKPYSESEIQEAYDKWLPKLQHALTDQLWNLIESYCKAVREHPNAKIENLSDLESDLKEVARLRNVVCHGSWRSPNREAASIPFFVNRQYERFETPIDVAYLDKVQRDTSKLICTVVNTVTHMGWQFPGSNGPGKVIWQKEQ